MKTRRVELEWWGDWSLIGSPMSFACNREFRRIFGLSEPVEPQWATLFVKSSPPDEEDDWNAADERVIGVKLVPYSDASPVAVVEFYQYGQFVDSTKRTGTYGALVDFVDELRADGWEFGQTIYAWVRLSNSPPPKQGGEDGPPQ